MEDMIAQIIERLLPANDLLLYGFLFLSAIIENLFPPIPGDTITAFGAFLVGTGRLNYLFVYISTTMGSVIGFMLLFYIGRIFGKSFFIEKDYRYFPTKKIKSTEKWFSKYGYFIVLANRFFPGVRSVISIVSGITMLHPGKVFIFALISSSVWNLIWIHTGYLLGDNWEVVKNKMGSLLKNYNITISIIMIISLVIFLVISILRRRRNQTC